MNISFGRYLPYNSLIHRLDPRIKMLSIIALIATVFISTGFTGYILTGTVIISIFFISKLPLPLLFSLFKFVIFVTLVLLVLNFFLIKPEFDTDKQPLWDTVGLIYQPAKFKILIVSWKAILTTLYISLRIYLMVLVTTILTSTTKPLDLTLALEDLMWSLKLIKIPVHIISIIISMALRMLPTLFEEAMRIKKAQASRGMDSKNGKFKDKIKSIISLIIPLLVSSFQKAEDMAYAMDVRGYDPHQKRTRFRQYRIGFLDVFILILIFSFLSLMVVLSTNIGIEWLNSCDVWKPMRYVDQFVWRSIIY
ncbi:energy-coupling factor transporter transmembrane protein EcfT [Spiroplasma endosymbiont of Agriotes lineatus]|uniref:energy-coupling factor transporter transmembrane component T family protein n=1 Tax=Spiroplasma endosymbiont of Agriotes lineatus TaxID=3077930 RepID=UPI0030CCAD66